MKETTQQAEFRESLAAKGKSLVKGERTIETPYPSMNFGNFLKTSIENEVLISCFYIKLRIWTYVNK